MRRMSLVLLMAITAGLVPAAAAAEGEWEVTPQAEEALADGLRWLAANQGPEGHWECKELGLVGMGLLAFLADGHLPGRGRYGDNVQRAIHSLLRHEKPSGLLNITQPQHDMYNHGLTTFVLGQAYGMSGDRRIGSVLDRALKLIAQTQCDDGGWHYHAQRMSRGHDLSLAVMQAKALRSAVDSGLDVAPQVIDLAIRGVREHYSPKGCPRTADEATQRQFPGQFTYGRGSGNASVAMAAAGVVCLQEFAQYDDWRIEKNMEVITAAIRAGRQRRPGDGVMFDAYTLYYVGQALYQVGGQHWRDCYPLLRDDIVANLVRQPNDARQHGRFRGNGRVDGKSGDLYLTSVACFVLAMPNRYLPILQEGRIDSLRQRFHQQP